MAFAVIKLFTARREERWSLPLNEGCHPAAE